MIENIAFDGFCVVSSNFSDEKSGSEKGYFNISLENRMFHTSPSNDSVPCKITINFTASIIGYEGEQCDEPNDDIIAFQGTVELETTFIDGNADSMSEDSIDEFMWFFDNFNYIATKLALNSLFKNTSVEGLPVPWSGK